MARSTAKTQNFENAYFLHKNLAIPLGTSHAMRATELNEPMTQGGRANIIQGKDAAVNIWPENQVGDVSSGPHKTTVAFVN